MRPICCCNFGAVPVGQRDLLLTDDGLDGDGDRGGDDEGAPVASMLYVAYVDRA
jgi:hypothetical protein